VPPVTRIAFDTMEQLREIHITRPGCSIGAFSYVTLLGPPIDAAWPSVPFSAAVPLEHED